MIEVLKQMVEALEVDAYVYNGEKSWAAIQAGKKAIAELESQEPVAWIALQKEAQQIVKSKVLWKKFIDGTPLVNDIACWMVDFALQHTHPPQRTEERNFCPRCGKRLGGVDDIHTCTPPQGIYYTAPQRSESSGKPSAWVGLTNDEIEKVWQNVETSDFQDCVQPFAQAVEAKLKEKNT